METSIHGWIGEPSPGKPGEPDFLQQGIDAYGGIEDPSPDDPGHHEGDGHGKEKDVSKETFCFNLPVQQGSQNKPEENADREKQYCKKQGIQQVVLKTDIGENLPVVLKAHEAEIGQNPIPGGKRGDD